MIPLKLTITGFGPYREEQTIDFTSMGEAPLFLITGPTGSGKTTILDAICYALYDRATWKSRDVKDMRCHNCTPDDRTIVSFDFSARGEVFRVEREPEYMRPSLKNRGGDEVVMTKNLKQAMIYKVTHEAGEEVLEPLVSQKGKVTERVVEILGLDAEQFCQVIVLPQGMTRELLTSKSSDRERIYEKLFNTSIYVAIEKELKQRKEDIDKQTATLTLRANEILEESGMNTYEELFSLVDELDEAREAAQEEQHRLNERLNTAKAAQVKAKNENFAFEEIARAEKVLSDLAEQQPYVDGLDAALQQHNLAEPLKPLHDAYIRAMTALPGYETAEREASQEAARLASELETAKNEDQVARDNAASRDGLLEQRAHLDGLLESVDELEIASTNLAAAINSAEKAKIAVDTTKTKANQCTTAHEEAQRDVSGRQDELKATPNFEARKLELKNIGALQRVVKEAKTQVTEAAQQLESDLAALVECKATYQEDNTAYQRLQKAWHLGQAAVLSEQLEEGLPCPVCGSEDHPLPAIAGSEDVSADQLEAARVAAECSMGARQSAETKVTTARDALDDANTAQNSAKEELDRENPDGIDVNEALAELEAQSRAAQAAREQLDLAIEAEDAKKEEMDAAIDAFNIAKEKKSEADGDVRIYKSKVDDLNARLPEGIEGAELLQAKSAALVEEINVLDQATQRAGDALIKAMGDHGAADAKAIAAAKSAQTARNEYDNANSAWQEALVASVFHTVEAWRLALISPDVATANREQIDNHRTAIAETNGGIREQQKTVKGIDEPHDMTTIEHQVEEYESGVASSIDALNKMTSDHAVKNNRLEDYIKNREGLAALNATFGPVDELYRVASGSASGRISLHRHIQGKLLDEVVARSNTHYYHMTNGRYALKRRTVASGGSGHDGLALDIHDTQSATDRSVSTLSGGESFQAQTALALGLSETVQAHAGGVQLETLFIDEGFGSLDAESLQLAIETLIELQASGRHIGVISHVESMNAQIDTQIQVVGGKSGSRLSVLV